MKERERRDTLRGSEATMKQIEHEFDSITDAQKWVDTGISISHVELPIHGKEKHPQLKPINDSEFNKQPTCGKTTHTSKLNINLQQPLVSKTKKNY